jgi:hypothetical protein
MELANLINVCHCNKILSSSIFLNFHTSILFIHFLIYFNTSIYIAFLFFSQGVVAFSSQGDRIALTQIEQMVDGQYYKLGYYDTQADNLTWVNKEQWIGGKVDKFQILH